jgi:hypothetical protein
MGPTISGVWFVGDKLMSRTVGNAQTSITGLFFVFVSYVEVLGSSHAGLSLSDLAAPVNAYHVSYLQAPISLGAMVSLFSLSLSCINAGARILYPMALHGAFPRTVGNTHDRNRTPHIAITVYTRCRVRHPHRHAGVHRPAHDVRRRRHPGCVRLLAGLLPIFVAAPIYLRRRGELTSKNIAVMVIALLCLLVPTVGSFYPLPPVPVRYFPYYFLAYMLVGVVWLAVLHRRDRTVLTAIEADLEATVDAHAHPAADSTAKADSTVKS